MKPTNLILNLQEHTGRPNPVFSKTSFSRMQQLLGNISELRMIPMTFWIWNTSAK